MSSSACLILSYILMFGVVSDKLYQAERVVFLFYFHSCDWCVGESEI